MEKEDLFKKRILDLTRMAYERNIVLFTNFLSLDELHMVSTIASKELGISLDTFGGYATSERQIAAFVPDALSYTWSYPLMCLQITPLSKKFSDVLTHRDFLGAILNLGINRSKIGDILVKENEAFVFCESTIGEFVARHLCKIKHTSILVKELQSFDQSFTPEVQEISGTVASVRLDSVIALAFNSSRSSLIPFIEGGKVYVNGKLITSNGYTLKEQDLVSVRGKGKFRYVGSLKTTKKGRCLVRVEKFI